MGAPMGVTDVAAPERTVGVGRLGHPDGVMGLGTSKTGEIQALTDLHRLDGLDAHEGLSQQGVQPSVPLHVAPQADGHAVGHHLGHAPQRIAFLGRRLHLGHHPELGLRIEAAHCRFVDARKIAHGRQYAVFVLRLAQLHDVAEDVHPDLS
jgi:hypothetical protein